MTGARHVLESTGNKLSTHRIGVDAALGGSGAGCLPGRIDWLHARWPPGLSARRDERSIIPVRIALVAHPQRRQRSRDFGRALQFWSAEILN